MAQTLFASLKVHVGLIAMEGGRTLADVQRLVGAQPCVAALADEPVLTADPALWRTRRDIAIPQALHWSLERLIAECDKRN